MEIAVAEFPQSGLAYNDLSFLFYLKGEKGRALNCYRKAIELDPNLPVAMKNLADFYLVEEGKVQEALAIYNRLLKNCPEDTEALLALGFISIKTNRPGEALSFYKRVLEIDPDNPTANEFLNNEEKR